LTPYYNTFLIILEYLRLQLSLFLLFLPFFKLITYCSTGLTWPKYGSKWSRSLPVGRQGRKSAYLLHYL